MANQYASAWPAPPLTGLVDGRFNRLLLALQDRTVDIRELFVSVTDVADVRERRVDIGPGASTPRSNGTRYRTTACRGYNCCCGTSRAWAPEERRPIRYRGREGAPVYASHR